MTRGETELELIPFVERGELLLLWQLHREGLGNAVEITTGQTLLPAPQHCSWCCDVLILQRNVYQCRVLHREYASAWAI